MRPASFSPLVPVAEEKRCLLHQIFLLLLLLLRLGYYVSEQKNPVTVPFSKHTSGSKTPNTSFSYLFFNPRPLCPFCCCCFYFVLFVGFLLSFWSLVCFVASDVLTTIGHLAIANVCMIIILYIGNTQISRLLLCFLYLFVELMIMLNESNLV